MGAVAHRPQHAPPSCGLGPHASLITYHHQFHQRRVHRSAQLRCDSARSCNSGYIGDVRPSPGKREQAEAQGSQQLIFIRTVRQLEPYRALLYWNLGEYPYLIQTSLQYPLVTLYQLQNRPTNVPQGRAGRQVGGFEDSPMGHQAAILRLG